MSKLKIRERGWKCGNCRFFREEGGAAYHGVCTVNSRKKHFGVHMYPPTMKEYWCDEFEKKEPKKKGGHVRGLFEDRGETEGSRDKTGGDR